MDKVDELAERLERLEQKTKATFLEVEKRLAMVPQEISIPDAINERLNEMEDLLLLSQVENAKLRDKVAGTQNLQTFESGDLEKRVQRLEEHAYAAGETPLLATDNSPDAQIILNRIDSIEERLKAQKPVVKDVPDELKRRLTDLDTKIDKLEAMEQIPRKYLDDRINSIGKDVERNVERTLDDFRIKYKSAPADKTTEALKDLDNVMLDVSNRLSMLESRKDYPQKKTEHHKLIRHHEHDKIVVIPDRSLLLEVKKILEGDE
jgi:DNA repair exonuclease SbcCD ATPase subunit